MFNCTTMVNIDGGKMKNEKFRGGFHIFPAEEENGSTFDGAMTEYARELILDTAELMEKPSMIQISVTLGMLRDRVSRLIDQLGIKDKYDAIKDAKKAETEERAAAIAENQAKAAAEERAAKKAEATAAREAKREARKAEKENSKKGETKREHSNTENE